jgi:hypothetical protein
LLHDLAAALEAGIHPLVAWMQPDHVAHPDIPRHIAGNEYEWEYQKLKQQQEQGRACHHHRSIDAGCFRSCFPARCFGNGHQSSSKASL